MISRIVWMPLAAASVLFTSAATTSRIVRPPDGLTVHEWGTFTSIAGEDGRAIEWLPLNGPVDLPCFVEHYKNAPLLKIIPTEDAHLIDYEKARASLWGKVRMETPVLYFYGPADTHVGVTVSFPRGLITEFYPHGSAWQSGVTATSLHSPMFSSRIEWPNVIVAPTSTRAFPTDSGPSHYYAARATDASPLAVGPQHEKFLFYRGVANFDVPISARAVSGGVSVANLGANDISNVVLYEKRGSTLGFRITGRLAAGASIAIDAPALTGDMVSLRGDLERMLTAAGLYPKEAAAMVATWSDSWFEDGTRVFYLVPPKTVDVILPLQTTPAASAIARVFVGRMEVVTPAVQESVESAIARNDAATLERFGRFLGPITDRMLANNPNPETRAQIKRVTSAAFASYVKRVSACE